MRARLTPIVPPLLALATAFALCAVAILAIGRSPAAAAAALAEGAFDGPVAFGETALKATALVLTGLAVALPYRAGLFNIGGQGQFLAGAIAAAWAGRALGLPAPLEIPAVLLFAAACGAAWGGLAGMLKARRGVHEVISTILLNWIAIHLIDSWLVAGPLHASGASGFSHGGTEAIRAAARFPMLLSEGRLSIGLPLALAAAFLVWWLLARTPFGLELRAIGASEPTARTVGIPVSRRLVQAMALGGALAGLAGAAMILGGGTDYRYPENYRDPYGFDGIAIALAGAGNPLGVVLAAGLFGALRAGAIGLQDPAVGLHRSWPDILEGVAVVLIAGQRVFAFPRSRSRARSRETAREPGPQAGPDIGRSV